MKPYVFSIGVLLTLAFSLTGLTTAVAGTLRHLGVKFGQLLPVTLASIALVTLVTALGWSVPPRG